jgi:hypothetical protein
LPAWIRQPSIAAENRGMQQGCTMMMDLLKDAGFSNVMQITSGGQPGVFATLDAGAPRTVGLYFMYDVKQADPAEWSSPPFEAALIDKPGLGKVVVGRGAVNQKGPEASFLAALHAMRVAARSCPSILSSSPRVRKKSARHAFHRSSVGLKCWQRLRSATGSSCPTRRRGSMATLP